MSLQVIFKRERSSCPYLGGAYGAAKIKSSMRRLYKDKFETIRIGIKVPKKRY